MKKISILVVAPYPEFGELAVDIAKAKHYYTRVLTLFLLYLGRVSWYSEQIDADITHHAYSYVFGIFSRCFGKRADDFPRHLSITMPYYRNSSAKRAKKYPE